MFSAGHSSLAVLALLVAVGISGDRWAGATTVVCNGKPFEAGFLCHKSARTGAERSCEWVDGITEEANVELLISETPKRCGSPNEKCVALVNVAYTQYASVSPAFEVDRDLVIDYQSRVDPNFTARATISGQAKCHVQPGYQAEVWLRAPLRRYKGNLDYQTTKVGTDGGKLCGRGLVKVDSPEKHPDGSLVCELECRLRPIADTTKVALLVNVQKMSAPDEVEAVKLAISKVIGSLPPMNEGVVQTAIVNGMQAWANGRCSNMNDSKTYHALCGACLKYLSDNILARTGYARGARWQTHDCTLRYEFYEIDAFSNDNVPDEFP